MKLNENKIKDMNIYLKRMQKSVLDKLFFIDKVFEPFDTIVDFGCANGELINAVQALFGEYNFVGYDISEDMINEAKIHAPNADYYTNWNEIDVDFSKSLLNISSTVHEVYSYCTKEEIDEFWERVFKSGFKYIAIRDMMFSEKEKDWLDKPLLEIVRNNTQFADKLRDYESVWGTIDNQHELAHYLLKYKYVQNWDREVHENYVGLSLEELHKLIPNDYEITYESHFLLPYTAWQIKNDFAAELTTPTHIKMILKKK